MKTDELGDESFKAQLKSGRPVKYWKKDDFIESINFLEIPDCVLEYETNDLERGLKTIVDLKVSEADLNIDTNPEENPLRFLLSDMRKAKDNIFRILFKSDQVEWEETKKEINIGKKFPFKVRLDLVFPPWYVGYQLIDLCLYYLRSTVS